MVLTLSAPESPRAPSALAAGRLCARSFRIRFFKNIGNFLLVTPTTARLGSRSARGREGGGGRGRVHRGEKGEKRGRKEGIAPGAAFV